MSDNENKGEEGKNRPIVIRNTTDLQRLKLEKLMKNPEKPIIIPEKPKERGIPAVPDFVRNVMGSSAGAGSGEFHVYRHLRRKEYARQRYMKATAEKEKLDNEYRDKLESNKRKAEEKTAKKRAKRLKKKQKIKKSKKQQGNDRQSSEESTESSESEKECELDNDAFKAGEIKQDNNMENDSCKVDLPTEDNVKQSEEENTNIK